eukprot:50863-Karenia_brevis.AAC.1
MNDDIPLQAALTESLHTQLSGAEEASQDEEAPEDRNQGIADAPLPAASSGDMPGAPSASEAE